MAKPKDRPHIRIEADDRRYVHVTWGRSGNRAILTLTSQQHPEWFQVELTVDKAAEVGRFLSAGPDSNAES